MRHDDAVNVPRDDAGAHSTSLRFLGIIGLTGFETTCRASADPPNTSDVIRTTTCTALFSIRVERERVRLYTRIKQIRIQGVRKGGGEKPFDFLVGFFCCFMVFSEIGSHAFLSF